MKNKIFGQVRRWFVGAGVTMLTAAVSAGCGGTMERFEQKVYKSSGGGPQATLQMRNFRFSLKNQETRGKDGRLKKVYYDVLKLKPGLYVLGFKQVQPRAGGYGLCRLPKSGKVYSFEVTDRVFMRQAGGYVLKGRCFLDPKLPENKGQK